MIQKPAETQQEIHELLKHRWSPYAFDEKPIPHTVLHSLFEAARWSPSSFNEQPWRLIVGTRDTDSETYQNILNTLTPSNQAWAGTAPVLILGIAKTNFSHNDAPNAVALYDLGQAVANLTFQASESGLRVHQMGGYDKDAARKAFAIPNGYTLAAVIALGYEGEISRLADEKLQARHTNTARTRKPLGEIIFTGESDTFGTSSPLL